MKHHLSHLLQQHSKEKKYETRVSFFITITASHFQAQKQGNRLCSNEICLLAEARSEKLLPQTQKCQKVMSKEMKDFYN